MTNIHVFLLAASFVITVLAVLDGARYFWVRRMAVRTKGILVDATSGGDPDTMSVFNAPFAQVQYLGKSKAYTHTSGNTVSVPLSYNLGDHLEVYYNPNNHSKVYRVSLVRPLVLLGIALAALLIGVLPLL